MNINNRTRFLSLVLIFLITLLFTSIVRGNFTNNVYVFDAKYSFFIQDPESVNYSNYKEIQTSKDTRVIFGKIASPVFVTESEGKLIYLSEDCKIIDNIKKDCETSSIKLFCNNNFDLVPQIYKSLKNFKVLSMKLVDQRRWQIVILKNDNTVTIDFSSGMPNVEEFENLDKKYKLTEKYKNIDLRFKNKIGIIE